MAQSRSRLERETVITFNEEESDAILWTASAQEHRRWVKLGLEIEPYGGGWRTTALKRWIKVRKPSTKQLTEEQRTTLANRMRTLAGRNRVAEDGKLP